MANKIVKFLIINAKATIGDVLAVEKRTAYRYIEGIKGEPEGLIITCLSEAMQYEKIDIKVLGLFQLPFELNGTPIPVEFEGLEGKIWQDWKNKGEIKLSLTATNVKLTK